MSNMLELLAAATIAMAPVDQLNPKLDWWRDARFGMFIHWGLYAVPAGTWEDKGSGHAEWIRTTAQIPLDTYDKFVVEFNPIHFDADAWCEMASDAGMGYIVITTKHHDGFCLFDSQHTEFDIMSTPFKRDIMAELAEAAPKHEVRMSWYHSIMDWHHPDYLPRRGWEKDRSTVGADMQRYRNYLHGQVEELLTNYGPIGIMWFDGEWESTWRGEYGRELYEHCMALQPEVIVNNRLGARGGMEGLTGMDGYAGGYGGDYMTPEQEIPDAVDNGIDWETCMTMNDRWGYNLLDKNFKSTTDLLQKLADIVSKNGNFLLNIGPKPDGTFPDESIQRLTEIGNWMDINGEAIHGTIGSPFAKLPWGRATQKLHDDSTTIYFHVFNWPEDGKLVIPNLAGTVQSVRILGAGETTFTMETGAVIVDVPSKMPSKHIGVVAVDVVGKPVIYEAPEISAPADIFVHKLDVSLTVGSPDLKIRYAKNDNSTFGIYRTPIRIVGTTTIRARSYDGNTSVSNLVTRTFTKVNPWRATKIQKHDLGSLACSLYEGNWDDLPDFTSMTPRKTELVSAIKAVEKEFVALVYEGFIYINSTNMIEFVLLSDDGSRLLIDEHVVIDHGGLHATQEKRGSAPLSKGWHAIRVEWFNKAGGASLDLKVGVLGEKVQPIDPVSFAIVK
jgi:alpha-L-fucosidase